MARTSVQNQGSNLFQTSAEDLNRIATDILTDGIVGATTNTSGVAPMTGGLSVNAQGSPNTTTAIGAGIAYVTATPTSQGSQRLAVKIDAQNVTHASNTSGATRYDWIYVKVDPTLAANPAVAGDTTGTIFVSRSTSSSVDNGTPPTYGYNIAVVTLANSFATVVSGNIADKRVQTGPVLAPASVTPSKLALAPQTAFVPASESTASGSYVDLTTTTDTVTATIGANGIALVLIQSDIANTTVNITSKVSVAVSGATTLAAGATTVPVISFFSTTTNASQFFTYQAHRLVTGLTPGTNTFKMKYISGGATSTFYLNRSITVIPL